MRADGAKGVRTGTAELHREDNAADEQQQHHLERPQQAAQYPQEELGQGRNGSQQRLQQEERLLLQLDCHQIRSQTQGPEDLLR